MLFLPLLLTTCFASYAAPDAAPAQKEADAIVEPGRRAPGGKVLEWKSDEDKTYWYRVPEKISEKKPPALILMLHGTGLPWGWAFWNYPIATGQFRGDDIVVAPEGMTPGANNTFNFVQSKNDGDHIAGLIRFFKSKYPIGRVYLYGHSQGAFFCYWFAGEYPELIDGIVAHAGNVLSVNHSQLAKDKVAIGILHGKADAVVTVECAYRTNEIYLKEGYKKVKLYVVEGLTAKSGHWPLPFQVGEMFEWLDSVSVATPGQALAVVEKELQGEDPDLALIAESLRQSQSLLKRYKEDDREELQSKLATYQGFMQQARAEHEASLLETAGVVKSKTPFAPWVEHFRAVDAAFAEDPAWKKSMKKARTLAAKHHKQVEKALSGLGVNNRKAFAAGYEALEQGFLSRRYAELESRILKLAENPPKGVETAQINALRDLIETRKVDLSKGANAAVSITSKAVDLFRAKHPGS